MAFDENLATRVRKLPADRSDVTERRTAKSLAATWRTSMRPEAIWSAAAALAWTMAGSASTIAAFLRRET